MSEISPSASPYMDYSEISELRSGLRSAIDSGVSPKKKFLIKRAKGSSERVVYTLAKKYTKAKEDGNPFPGSLEEDLTATPDTFFDKSFNDLDNSKLCITSEKFGKQWGKLAATEVIACPQIHSADKVEPPLSVKFKGLKSVLSQNYSSSGGNKFTYDNKSKKAGKKIDITDPELAKRYEEVFSRIKVQYGISHLNRLYGTKEERFFNHHKRVQQNWEWQLKIACKKLNRPIESSVMTRGEGYREKVEKLTALDAITPSEIKYGLRNWGMELRRAPQSKEARHYDVHLGNSYTGLWMRVTDNPNKQTEIIRNPQAVKGSYKTYQSSEVIQEKIKKESRRLSEVIILNDESIDDLQVVGVNALKVEYEGFTVYRKAKLINANSEEDIETEDI